MTECPTCQLLSKQNEQWAGQLGEALRKLERIEALLPTFPQPQRHMIENILAGRYLYDVIEEADSGLSGGDVA